VKCENEIFASTPSGRQFGSNGLIPLQKNDEVDYLRAPSGRHFGSNGLIPLQKNDEVDYLKPHGAAFW
jgi:hypothetical protein